MTLCKMSNRLQRWALGLFAGASVYQIAGCDQNVSDILTQGFADAAITLFSALVNAFFQGLNAPDGNISVTTVSRVIENLSTFLT